MRGPGCCRPIRSTTESTGREPQADAGRSRAGGGNPDPVPGLRVDRHRFNGGWPQQGPGEEELRAHLVVKDMRSALGFPEGVE